MARIFFSVMSVANLMILAGRPGVVQNRIVGRLDPDLAAALADELVFGRLKFTAIEARPKRLVGLAAAQLRRREHLMMLALDFRRDGNPSRRGSSGWR